MQRAMNGSVVPGPAASGGYNLQAAFTPRSGTGILGRLNVLLLPALNAGRSEMFGTNSKVYLSNHADIDLLGAKHELQIIFSPSDNVAQISCYTARDPMSNTFSLTDPANLSLTQTVPGTWSTSDALQFSEIGTQNTSTSQADITILDIVQSAADPATPATQIVDFSQGIAQKNKTGLAYMFGVTSQYVMQSGMTVGLSINYGKTGSSSTTDYAAGSISGTSFAALDNIRFSTKDTGFVSELLQLGYAYHRFNPYIIFGLAQHRAKMFCPDAYQNAGRSITKGYNTPVFGLGMNVAMTKNVYVNLQWQRHMGGVKNWGNIADITPKGRLAMGSPQSRMGSNMILFGVTCVTNFNGRR